MDQTLGILGGGQLGRMLCEAANKLNLKTLILDSEGSPAKQIHHQVEHVAGSFRNSGDIRRLADRCEVMTFEIEHVDVATLKTIAEKGDQGRRPIIQPHWQTIQIIQDKFRQKQHLLQHQIAVADSREYHCAVKEEVARVVEEFGYPFMLKSRLEAYDGRGNMPIANEQDLALGAQRFGQAQLYAERWIDFEMELAVMVVKTKNSTALSVETSTLAFPVVETVHQHSICKLVYVPPRGVQTQILDKAQRLARSAVSTFPGKGIFGVELFLLKDGRLLINEIAPRPHNSGHFSIEACGLSQFDAHLRAVLDYPIPEKSLRLRAPASNFVMMNIIGGRGPEDHLSIAKRALSVPGANVHLYGKGPGRLGRKMGHVTLQASSLREAEESLLPLLEELDKCWGTSPPSTRSLDLNDLSIGGSQKQRPVVAITMGSDSDLEVLIPGIELLDYFGIPYTTTITSAHRTPERMSKFAAEAAARGFLVVIAAAGGAAHLPGMIAANTWLPVIGVPVQAKVLDGLDSLLSIVQMPRGCPVGTVAINNSVNAAQLAIRILAIQNDELAEKLRKYLCTQQDDVEGKALKMEQLGPHAYRRAR